MTKSPYVVYMLRVSDGSLYTGITNNLERRLKTHGGGGKAASKYVRTRLPFTIVYVQQCKDKSVALKREWEIKRLTRREKEALVASQPIVRNMVRAV